MRPAANARRVLVTGAGGPSAVSILKSLARPPAVDLWAADIDRHAAGLYLVPAPRRLLLPRGDDPAFVGALLEWCRSEAVDLVIPTVDAELLPIARRRSAFVEAGIDVMLASEACLATCLDKWLLAQRCVGRLPVPRTELHDGSVDLRSWRLPVILKPRSGSGSRDVVRIDHPAELARYQPDSTRIVQEYLPGEEYSIDVLADPAGTVLAVVPRARLRIDSGVAVAGRTIHDDELDRLARDVAAAVGLGWVANVQARRDVDGVARLLEVNPRFPGTMPLTVAAGVDMPRLSLLMASGERPPEPLRFVDLAMVRFLEERFLEPAELERVPARPTAGSLV